jgi:hypothetical protein
MQERGIMPIIAPTMGSVFSLFVYFLAAALVLFAVVFLLIDMFARVDYLKDKFPWMDRLLQRRGVIGALLLVAIFLLAGDGYELLIKELPGVPAPPIVRIIPPAAPVIQFAPTRSAPRRAKIALLYGSTPLAGQAIISSFDNPGTIMEFILSDVHAKNEGDAPTEQTHARLYFSDRVILAVIPGRPSSWTNADNDDGGFPTTFSLSNGGRIDPKEIADIAQFHGLLLNWKPGQNIRVRIKFFYGGEAPAVADFIIGTKAK